MFYKKIVKPVADVISAFVLLLVLSPIIILTIVVLGIVNRGQIFFHQPRPGLKAKIFKIIKFKTMRDEFDREGRPLPDELRLTRIGQFVRSASIDELPQFLNVIKGEMSIVGPRPLLVQYLSKYSEDQARRHEVKPGITGWAQVNGRNAISWEDKFCLDVEYVDNQSFFLDMKIIWLTMFKVIRRKNISSDYNVTMDEFKGGIEVSSLFPSEVENSEKKNFRC